MSDFGTLQAKILDDINRDDMTAQVQDAIVAAVKFYDKKSSYWFQEERVETTVVPNQAYYSLPDDYHSKMLMTLTEDSDTYKVSPKDMGYIEENYEGFTARPCYFALWDNQIRLYPTPDQTATLNLFYQKRLNDVSATSTYTSEWLDDGYELIRARAKADVLLNTLHDTEAGSLAKQMEREEKDALDLANVRRKRTGKIKKHNF